MNSITASHGPAFAGDTNVVEIARSISRVAKDSREIALAILTRQATMVGRTSDSLREIETHADSRVVKKDARAHGKLQKSHELRDRNAVLTYHEQGMNSYVEDSNEYFRQLFPPTSLEQEQAPYYLAEITLHDIERAMVLLTGDEAAAHTFCRDAKAQLYTNPFRGDARFDASQIARTVKADRARHLVLHAAYLRQSIERVESSLEGLDHVTRDLIASGLPNRIERRPAAFAAALTYLQRLTQTVIQASAANRTPKSFAALRAEYLDQHGTALELAAQRHANALIAEENALTERLSLHLRKAAAHKPMPQVRHDDAASATLSPGRISVTAAHRKDPKISRFWTRYAELNADPHADAEAWVQLLDEFIADEIPLHGMRDQIYGHLAHALAAQAAERRLSNVSLQEGVSLEHDAESLCRKFCVDEAIGNAERCSALRTQLIEAVEHGLNLHFGAERDAYFFGDRVDAMTEASALRLHPNLAAEPSRSLEIRALAANTGVAMYVARSGDDACTGYTMSLASLLRVVGHGAVEAGTNGRQLLATAYWLQYRLRSLEEAGASIDHLRTAAPAFGG